jgi:hypothetical protein
MASRQSVQEVLEGHRAELMAIAGVVGVAVGECEGSPCISVLVVKETPELSGRIPKKLDGFAVVIQETGGIRALDTD